MSWRTIFDFLLAGIIVFDIAFDGCVSRNEYKTKWITCECRQAANRELCSDIVKDRK